MNKFDTPEYKRSRAAYATQCTIEYFISLLITDAFLAKLLSSIGISDALIGIISSFVSMAFIIQLMSLFLVNSRLGAKRLVMTFDTLSNIFYMVIYLIPFFPCGKTLKTVLVIISILVAYTCKYLISSIHYKWSNSNVEPTKRASYSAVKESISLVSGIVFTAVIGYIMDKFEGLGNLSGAFLFISVSILILNICNFISLLLIRKEDASEAENGVSVKDSIKYILSNKSFKNVILLSILWDSARYFSIGFMGILKTKDLAYSMLAVQIINMAGNLSRLAISVPFGRYSDKRSYARGFNLAMCIAALAFFVNMFTTRSTRFLIIVYTILNSCSLAGTNQNAFNIAYSYVDQKYVVQAMAIKNSIAGICGFIASLLGGKLLSAIQAGGNMIFGIPVLGQQVLSAISLVITVAAIIFTRTVIEKQKVSIQ